MWGKRRFLTAPHRVIVIRSEIEVFGCAGVIHMLVQSTARDVMGHKGIRHNLFDELHLKIEKSGDASAAEPLPVQTQGRVVGGNRLGRQWDFIEAVVFLRPEGGPVGLIECVDTALEFFLQIALERAMALGTIADVAALVPNLIVDLPRHNLVFLLVMLHQRADDLFGISIHSRTVKTIETASAETPFLPPFRFGKNLRMLFGQPCGDGGSRGSHQDFQTPFLRLFDHPVKKAEIIAALGFLHQMPGKFSDPDDVAAQLHNPVQIRFQQTGVPLFGVIVNA